MSVRPFIGGGRPKLIRQRTESESLCPSSKSNIPDLQTKFATRMTDLELTKAQMDFRDAAQAVQITFENVEVVNEFNLKELGRNGNTYEVSLYFIINTGEEHQTSVSRTDSRRFNRLTKQTPNLDQNNPVVLTHGMKHREKKEPRDDRGGPLGSRSTIRDTARETR